MSLRGFQSPATGHLSRNDRQAATVAERGRHGPSLCRRTNEAESARTQKTETFSLLIKLDIKMMENTFFEVVDLFVLVKLVQLVEQVKQGVTVCTK